MLYLFSQNSQDCSGHVPMSLVYLRTPQLQYMNVFVSSVRFTVVVVLCCTCKNVYSKVVYVLDSLSKSHTMIPRLSPLRREQPGNKAKQVPWRGQPGNKSKQVPRRGQPGNKAKQVLHYE